MVPWKDGWTVLSCINKSLHRKMRRTLMDGMSDTTLREFEPIVLAQLDLLIQMLTKSESTSSKWSEAFDMSQWGKPSLNVTSNLLLTRVRTRQVPVYRLDGAVRLWSKDRPS